MQPLPIDPHLPAVVGALRDPGSIVLVAEPGAGKTTRVPRALLDASPSSEGEIIVSEPRRLAVRMAARRVAAELGEQVGGRVGYSVRFDDRSSARTRVRFVTDGVLGRRLDAEPTLPGVSVVLLDELHERHLTADLALARLHLLRQTARPDLRIGVMSATLDAAAVSTFLGCDVLEVPGRTFEVELRHLDAPDSRPLAEQVAAAVRRLIRDGLEGDVLVFLPGAAEIRRAHEACEPLARGHGLILATLHGDLPAEAQDRAVRTADRPKVILSTNVAESSVTIEGVVAVVDSGLARVARHSPWSGLPGLETAKISRASAAQRAGRAGRTRPGICLRLYTRHDHDTRPLHDVPEILRADMTATVLSLRAAGHDPAAFPFFEAPAPAATAAADVLLRRLGLVDEAGGVTAEGRRALALPVHPRLGRLLAHAHDLGAGEEGCLVAALLSEREIRRSARTWVGGPSARTDAVGNSDVLARMEAFEAAEHEGLSPRVLRAHDLDPAATHAVVRGREQLRRALDRWAPTVGATSLTDREEAVLRAVLAAYPDRVGRRRTRGGDEVVFAGGGSARFAPAGVVKEAELLVAVEVEERRRGGALVRAASAIEPEWLLELFPHRIGDSEELRFDGERERVERVRALTYEGLELDASREPASGAGASRVLLEAALAAGFARFCDAEALALLRRRVAFAAAHDDRIAPWTDTLLAAALEEACEGATSFAEVRRVNVLHLLRARGEAGQGRRVDGLAPATVPLPGRPRGVPIHYEEAREPWVESHLQDFFGLSEGPRVAEGRVPLVLHLLGPNGRAVQVTTDLGGFWDRHYPPIRKSLMRRYPRHNWPEDPRTAEARRLKRR